MNVQTESGNECQFSRNSLSIAKVCCIHRVFQRVREMRFVFMRCEMFSQREKIHATITMIIDSSPLSLQILIQCGRQKTSFMKDCYGFPRCTMYTDYLVSLV